MDQLPAAHGLLLPAALVAGTIVLWATAWLPEYLTALIFFAVAMVLHVAPADAVFAGFLSSAFWLVLSGFVLGAAIRKVGLADRIARLLSRHITSSWPRMVAGVVLLAYGLAFVMPSNMGRIALLIPVVLALADQTGLTEGSRGRIGLVLAVGIGTYQLSATILPANVPNLVMTGAAESAYGLSYTYLSYLLLHTPVLGILKGIALTICVCVMFPAKPRKVIVQDNASSMSRAEIRLSVLLLVTLALWMTDTWHGISPAWVGLTAACLCLLPRIGFLTGDEFAAAVNTRACIYVACILGLAAVVARTGLGDAIGLAVLPLLPLDPARPGVNFAVLVALAVALNFIITANGLPALFTPLARALADHTGLPLASVLMVQVVGYGTPLMPYQASPVVVAMEMGRTQRVDGIKLCLVIAVITFLVLVPLDYAWFRLLGWIG